ncbi:LexA/Signal peptidase [Ganoderma leucocontextum]|nr:LexA/Signal peptidase [Ganoderma leucocontextum]
MQTIRLAGARWAALRQSGRDHLNRQRRLRWFLSALVWLPLGLFVTEYGFNIKSVKGRSMQPTLNPDDSLWRDIVLFDRFSVKLRKKYERGDVVAFKSPADSKLVVKRIIALEGDTVRTLPPYPDAEVRVPVGRVWVEGDEPFRTEDSNRFGPVCLSSYPNAVTISELKRTCPLQVPLGLIESRLSFILWPWERIGPLGQPVVPRHDAKRGTPGWRKSQADLEREQWRNSRVTIAQPPQTSQS